MVSLKKILLTGGAGFIGKNAAEQLSLLYDVAAPTRQELDLLNPGSVKEFFTRFQFDIVVHLAAAGVSRSKPKEVDVFRKNTEMFLNLASNANGWSRLINLGSGAEYDISQNLVNVKESQFGQNPPKDDYGRAKYFISEQIQKSKNMMNLRCFGVFGKYEDYASRFISNAICRALAGLPIVVGQNRVFDYIYVNDLVKIIAFFINHEPGEKFYNACSGQRIELLNLAELVKLVTGSKLEIQIKRPGVGPVYSGDNSKLLGELGEFEFTPLKQAIEQLVLWYRENWALIDKAKLNFDA